MKIDLNIYIVEDQRLVALDIAHHVKLLGYNVVGISASGEDCIEQLNLITPDLILMDINLSGNLSGIETANKINEYMSIPIVFITAYSDDKTLKEIKRSGSYGYITKPFKETDLKTEIDFTYDRFNKLLKLKREHDDSRNSLKERERFFQQVVSNVSDIIYRIDLKGFFTYVNPSTERQSGYSLQELLNMKYTRLIRPDYEEKVYAFFKKIYQNKIDNSYFEFPMVTKNGQEVWIGQKIHLLISKSNVVGFQVVARDITLEKEFKEQLIIAKKNAENTAEIKSQFLANMSHEIRTPLNGIMGVIHLLNNSELNEKQKTYINAIISSSNQLMGIINDILDLSKIEAGKMELDNSEFDIYDLIQSVISIFEIKTIEKAIELTFQIDPNIPQFLIGDSIHLNQILYNLIGNSVKFTDNGSVNLKIDLIEFKDDIYEVQFSITDTGIGMDAEVIDKIFDAFTQAEINTTRQYGGTGLGLAIVKRLVDLHDGTIKVKSDRNEGSSFILNINFKRAEIQSDNKTNAIVNEYSLLNGLSILLVEDNLINQLVTSDILKEQGVEVEIAGNGKIALEMLDAKIYDLVLMDMQMPIMDGYQAMSAIRKSQNELIKGVPIIALTANAIDSEIKKCYKFGANDYLSKPFKPEYLYQKICNQMNNSEIISKIENKGIQELLDMTTLEMFTNGKVELVQSILIELGSSFSKDFESIVFAKNNEDDDLIRSFAHKIKPNFMLIGMTQLGNLCLEIEHCKESNELHQKVNLLIHSMPHVLQEINEYAQNETPTFQ